MVAENHHIPIAPPAYESGLHLTSAVRQYIAVPRAVFLQWAARTPLDQVLPGTRLIAAVERTEPVLGTYPEPGSIRRVILADGSHALEVIHHTSEEAFQYQVWGFTAAPFIKYARCAFYYTEQGEGCLVDWRYESRPRAILFAPLVFLFARFVFRSFMQKGMGTIRELAETSYRERGTEKE
jgi:hypothetical protein